MYNRKSQLLGFTLTFLFGPLGLLYASVTWGLGLIIVAAVVGALTFGIGALLIWPFAIIASFVIISSHNDRVAAAAAASNAYMQYQHDIAVWQAKVITGKSDSDF